ncbi:MAG: ATP-binding cassette domain-containing protein [Oscillospiraceae bacterium]|nr:ATP-binding cassette domain-containing protein [Oscillospiraceae bacterium]
MLLSTMQNIKISAGTELLFALDKLDIYEGDIVGVVGKNGSGKTTLLNMIAGSAEPDLGYVKNFCELSYFRQFNENGENNLSGGEITKIYLSDAIEKNAPLLLLDEPTSNLDISSTNLLEKQIKNYNGAVVLISHDRRLLENTCTKIVNIDKDAKTAAVYECGYADFVELKEKESERAEFLYEAYNKERRRLTESIRESKAQVKSAKKAPSRMGNSEARLHKRKTGERMESVESKANALKTRLEKLEVHEKPRKQRKIGITLKDAETRYKGRYIIECENLNVAFGERILLENVSFRLKTGSKAVLVGDNGSGKTTLVKKILDEGCENIKSNAKKIAYYEQGLEILESSKTILENVMLESAFTELEARNILGRLGIREDNVHKKVEYISGGEKVKVCFAKIFTEGADLAILDEPTNYLDIETSQALEDIINEYDGTVLAISHDRSFAENISDCVIEIDAKHKSIKYFDDKYRMSD